MIEREEPRFVKFATGEVLEGILVSIQGATVGGKSAVRYTVLEEGGQYACFIGTHQLNTKLRAGDRGHRVEILCEGEDTMIKRGDNCMKVFRVKVSREPVTAVDPLMISDDDIPF